MLFQNAGPKYEMWVKNNLTKQNDKGITLTKRQKPHKAPASGLCDTATAGCRRPSPHSRTLACGHTAIRSPSLPFNGIHHRNPSNYIDLLLIYWPGGMEVWVGLVGWPIADSLLTVVTCQP